MQKVTKFLEAYVQWVAVGLGVLWILFIGYAYWAKSAVSATVATSGGSKVVGPGDVDDLANDGPVTDLNNALQGKVRIPEAVAKELQSRGPEYLAEFTKRMALEDVAVGPMSPVFSSNFEIAKKDGSQKITDDAGPSQFATIVLAAEKVLTSVQPAKGNRPDVASGLSVVWWPNPSKPAPVNLVNGGNPVGVGVGVRKDQGTTNTEIKVFTPKDITGGANAATPALPENGRSGSGGVVAPPTVIPLIMDTKDQGWSVVSSVFHMAPVADAFKASGLPQDLSGTAFLRVRVLREEQLPDGSWSKELELPDLTNDVRPAWPPKTPQEEGTYLDWAQKNQIDVIQPPFYDVVRGNQWRTGWMPELADVAAPDAAVAGGAAAFDPALIKPGEVGNLPPDQRKAWFEWKKQQDLAERERLKSERESHKGAAPAGGGAGLPRGGPARFAPVPPNDVPISPRTSGRTAQPMGGAVQLALAEVAPPSAARGGARPNRDPVGVAPGTSGLPGAGPAAGATATPEQPINPADYNHGTVPTAPFTPSQLSIGNGNGDVEVWGHDDTAIPGHTYRYKIEVSIKNPLYANPNAKLISDQQKLALTVATDWSDPVTQPLRQRFFAINGANAIGNNAKMAMEYFWWEDGQWKSKQMTVQPGDGIANTGWTVVDFRPVKQNSPENRVLLVNENGDTIWHYFRDDDKDPEHTKLKAQVSKTTPGATPTGAPTASTGS